MWKKRIKKAATQRKGWFEDVRILHWWLWPDSTLVVLGAVRPQIPLSLQLFPPPLFTISSNIRKH